MFEAHITSLFCGFCTVLFSQNLFFLTQLWGCVWHENPSPPITEQSSLLLLPPILILHDPHSYPSPFCCFAACVDVYGTHSNVHLCCFHTGKSTASRRRSVTPESYQCHWTVVITLISLVIVSSCPAFFPSWLSVSGQTAARSTPFICSACGHLFLDDISVLIIIFTPISLTDVNHFDLNSSNFSKAVSITQPLRTRGWMDRCNLQAGHAETSRCQC